MHAQSKFTSGQSLRETRHLRKSHLWQERLTVYSAYPVRMFALYKQSRSQKEASKKNNGRAIRNCELKDSDANTHSTYAFNPVSVEPLRWDCPCNHTLYL